MFINRFSKWTVVFIVAAIALITLVAANAYLEGRRGEGINPDTYYPLPPGKQTILVNEARRSCLHPGHGVQTQAVVNPDTYYPLPPGKQTALVNAAIQACIDDHLSEWAGK